jgi:hypothetical protein
MLDAKQFHMLWFDDDPTTELTDKIQMIAEYFDTKYGYAPKFIENSGDHYFRAGPVLTSLQKCGIMYLSTMRKEIYGEAT